MKMLILVLLLSAGLVISTTLLATTYYVDDTMGDDNFNGLYPEPGTFPDGPKKTIQAGIDVAGDTDTVLVADGTYTGPNNKDIDFSGKAITLQSENGAAKCIIDCENDGRGFYFHSAETAASVVDGLTIKNGNATGDYPEDCGGGIRCENGSSPTIINCLVIDSIAERCGGGIFLSGSNPTINSCALTGNTAGQGGGGIYCSAVDMLTISGCTFSGNTAPTGGAVYFGVSTVTTIADCQIDGNTSTGSYPGNAAGIFCDDGSEIVIDRCVISNNQGSGIAFDWEVTGTATNCLIAGNTQAECSAIYCHSKSNTIIENCTITGNIGNGYAVFCMYPSTALLKNCILWNERTGELFYDVAKPATVEYCDIRGGWPGPGTNNISLDPLLRADGRLEFGSPCIDYCTDGPQDDIDGEARPFPAGGSYDIGADEFVDTDGDEIPDWWEDANGLDKYNSSDASLDGDSDGLNNLGEYANYTNPNDNDSDDDGRSDSEEVAAGTNPLNVDNLEKTYYVKGTTGDDSDDGLAAVWDGTHGPKKTIQAGIDATTCGWGYVVLVENGIYKGLGNKNLDYAGKAITVRSRNGPSFTTIDCMNDGRAVYFHNYETPDSVFDGFTVGKGNADHGGGIYLFRASASILNCVFDNNTATSSGGAIHASTGNDMVISSCTFTGNSALSFGALAIYESENARVEDCNFTGNSATRRGGAILDSYSNSEYIDCVISDNSCSEEAGGVYLDESESSFVRCVIRRNSAGQDGGGIYIEDGSAPSFIECQIIENNSGYFGGGGVKIEGLSDVVFVGCSINSNDSVSVGGGLHVEDNSSATLESTMITHNEGSWGGGVMASSGCLLDMKNCAIMHNDANEYGGGLYLSALVTATNCTIAHNAAVELGGGIRFDGNASSQLTNCIIWDNSPDELSARDTVTSSFTYCDIEGGWPGEGNFSSDPLLTGDGHLITGSPCIDYCVSDAMEDIDGEGRPEDIPGVGYNSPSNRLYDVGADEYIDSDGDGMADWYEEKFGLNKNDPADAVLDADSDSLTNLEEYEAGTDPNDTDTDEDNLSDDYEVQNDIDPLDPDCDDDGLTDGEEVNTYMTDPWDPDSDGDWHEDGWEVDNGYDPNSADSPGPLIVYVNGSTGDDSYDGLAAVWDGTHGPKKIIQAAIDVFTLNTAGNTVTVADGTYKGEGNKNIDFRGFDLVVKSENGLERTIIDCENDGRGFCFHSGETHNAVVEGFTITRGDISGIACTDSSPTIRNCTISGNSVIGYGGGISCDRSDAIITDCMITNNSTTSWNFGGGGGIAVRNGKASVTNCIISTNFAGELGGGIRCDTTDMTIANCTIQNNYSREEGGGIHVRYSRGIISKCVIENNTSDDAGGGIGVMYIGGASTVVVENCMITNNGAQKGGGFHCYDGGDATIRNCTLVSNRATVAGGAVDCESGDIILENTILWNNVPQEINVWLGAVAATYCDIRGGWAGVGNIDANPLLRSEWHLQSGSPCMDWCPNGAEEDIDGDIRPFDVPGVGYDDPPDARTFDIGADEFVDSDGDGMPDYWENQYGLDPEIDDSAQDKDSDGLTNIQEFQLETNPSDADSDDDGLDDGDEVNLHGTDPLDFDSDDDGMPDGWEVMHGLDPLADDAGQDPDDDGLTNLEEYGNDTDPHNEDTDGDGMDDGWEVDYGLKPLIDDADEDPDSDGQTNIEEWEAGTNPMDPASLFAVVDIDQSSPGGSEITLTWTSADDRWYFVYYSDSPFGDWMEWYIADVVPASGLGLTSWTDTGEWTGVPPNEVPHRYYMVMAYLPPF